MYEASAGMSIMDLMGSVLGLQIIWALTGITVLGNHFGKEEGRIRRMRNPETPS